MKTWEEKFDDDIRKKVSGSEVQPPPRLFDQIIPEEKKKRGFLWIWITGIIILVSTALTVHFNTGKIHLVKSGNNNKNNAAKSGTVETYNQNSDNFATINKTESPTVNLNSDEQLSPGETSSAESGSMISNNAASTQLDNSESITITSSKKKKKKSSKGNDSFYYPVRKSKDNNLSGAGYGMNPPAQGVYFLNQTLSGSMTYDNINSSPLGNPSGCNDYYNLLSSIWLDNQPLTYGDNGRDPSNPITTYVYPGITDPNLFSTNGAWDESVAGNFPGDRRIIGAIGPFNLPANGVITFDIGYTYSRATSGGPLASVAQLQADVAALRLLYDSGSLTGISDAPIAVNEVTVSPNPASEYFTVKSDDKNTFDLELFNMNGQLVHAKRNCRSEESISLRNYEKGIYMIRISGEKGIQHKKLVVH